MSRIGTEWRIKAFAILIAIAFPFGVAFAFPGVSHAAVFDEQTFYSGSYLSTQANAYGNPNVTITPGKYGTVTSATFMVNDGGAVETVYAWIRIYNPTTLVDVSHVGSLGSVNTLGNGVTTEYTISTTTGILLTTGNFYSIYFTVGSPWSMTWLKSTIEDPNHKMVQIDRATTSGSLYFSLGGTVSVEPPAQRNCGITDISGCIVNGLTYVFLPTEADWAAFHAVSFASTSPYGYIPAIQTQFSGFASTSATSSIGVNLSVFSSLLGTSTVPIMSVNMIQATIGPTWWGVIQALLGGIEWLIFMFWIYELAIWLV